MIMIHANKIADFGAGSGILGIELGNHFKAKKVTFIEAQPEYKEHLDKNISDILNPDILSEVDFSKFSDWIPKEKYDLIVCNPPYYLPGHGQNNNDRCRLIARSFILDGWSILLDKIKHSLGDEGQAFIVIKDDFRILNEFNKFSSGFKKVIERKEGLCLIQLFRLNEE